MTENRKQTAPVEDRVAELEREMAGLRVMLCQFTYSVTLMLMPDEAEKIRAEFVEKYGEGIVAALTTPAGAAPQ